MTTYSPNVGYPVAPQNPQNLYPMPQQQNTGQQPQYTVLPTQPPPSANTYQQEGYTPYQPNQQQYVVGQPQETTFFIPENDNRGTNCDFVLGFILAFLFGIIGLIIGCIVFRRKKKGIYGSLVGFVLALIVTILIYTLAR
eukprot:TRINITY_DN364_c0_g1_i1.p1 TRINITY_DN364_c0_g1~~TRINITY_DN364_c0_g1_i1.p1  ORF type:complete len:140 (-),score=17.33 TRINITY_DN364_c0_g1_i1:64-483(-)